jgi:hypothetical protein
VLLVAQARAERRSVGVAALVEEIFCGAPRPLPASVTDALTSLRSRTDGTRGRL